MLCHALSKFLATEHSLQTLIVPREKVSHVSTGSMHAHSAHRHNSRLDTALLEHVWAITHFWYLVVRYLLDKKG